MANGAHIKINIEQKSFSPETTSLFADLKLQIEPSEIVALVGPSGIGKSTLLRLVAGIDTDFEGHIQIDGKSPQEAPIPGFVFQDPRLLPWLTSEANIRVLSNQVSAQDAERLLKEVGLEGNDQALPHQLSGGMQRRVALARALALSPTVLLLDEPFVSLDRKLARELHQVFLSVIKSYAPTVLLISHDIEDAAQLADRIVLLSGRPAQVALDYKVPGIAGQRDPMDIVQITDKITESGG